MHEHDDEQEHETGATFGSGALSIKVRGMIRGIRLDVNIDIAVAVKMGRDMLGDALGDQVRLLDRKVGGDQQTEFHEAGRAGFARAQAMEIAARRA